MNKNAPKTTLILRSRKKIKQIFRGKKAQEAEGNLFLPKPIRMYGQLLASRGDRAVCKKKRTVVVDFLTPWSRIIGLRTSGMIPLVRGSEDTLFVEPVEA
jgi:hypothetical protein